MTTQHWQDTLTALMAAPTDEAFQALRAQVNEESVTRIEDRRGQYIICSAPIGRGDYRHHFLLRQYADGVWRKE